MQILTNLSTNHDVTEDRIMLVGTGRDGGRHLMWMTRRLVDYVVVA